MAAGDESVNRPLTRNTATPLRRSTVDVETQSRTFTRRAAPGRAKAGDEGRRNRKKTTPTPR